MWQQHQPAAGVADENGDEGGRLDQTVAGDHLRRRWSGRMPLQQAEELACTPSATSTTRAASAHCRAGTEAKPIGAVRPPSERGSSALSWLSASARVGGQQHVRNMNRPAARAFSTGPAVRLEQRQHYQCIAHQVVVQRHRPGGIKRPGFVPSRVSRSFRDPWRQGAMSHDRRR